MKRNQRIILTDYQFAFITDVVRADAVAFFRRPVGFGTKFSVLRTYSYIEVYAWRERVS